MEKQKEIPDSLKESLMYPRGKDYEKYMKEKMIVEGEGAPEVQIKPTNEKGEGETN